MRIPSSLRCTFFGVGVVLFWCAAMAGIDALFPRAQAQEKPTRQIVEMLPSEHIGNRTFLSEVQRMSKANKAATTCYAWSMPGTFEWVICWKKGLWLPRGSQTVVYQDDGLGRVPIEIGPDGAIVGVRLASGGPKWYEAPADETLPSGAVKLPIIIEK